MDLIDVLTVASHVESPVALREETPFRRKVSMIYDTFVKWHLVTSSPSIAANNSCNCCSHKRGRQPLLPLESAMIRICLHWDTNFSHISCYPVNSEIKNPQRRGLKYPLFRRQKWVSEFSNISLKESMRKAVSGRTLV
jgi:hypothetical protein